MEAFIPSQPKTTRTKFSTLDKIASFHFLWSHPLFSPLSPPPLMETNPHTLCHNAFDVQNVRVVKLAHDCCLSKEVPPLAIWRRVLQGLNGHSLTVLAGDSQGPLIYFPKLSWMEKETGSWPSVLTIRGMDDILSSSSSLFFSGSETWCALPGTRARLYFLGKETGVQDRNTFL